MSKFDDFVMTIDDDEEIVVEDAMEDVEEEEEKKVEKPLDKKALKKARKQANREQKQGVVATMKANVEKKKKSNEESVFDDQFSFSMDGGSGPRAQKDWDFTAARGMLKGKQV